MLDSKRVLLLRIAGLCGVVSPVISLASIALAIACTLQFHWFTWALSDLGVHEAAPVFNSGLVAGGILATIFAVELTKILSEQVLGFVGGFTLVLSTFCLCAIGLIAESAGRIHLYASLTFFALLTISCFLIGAALMQKSSQQYLGLFSILTVVVAAVAAWVVPHEGPAIPEVIASVAASIWSVVLSIKLFKTT